MSTALPPLCNHVLRVSAPLTLVLTCAMQRATLPAAPPTPRAMPSVYPHTLCEPPLAFTPAQPRVPLITHQPVPCTPTLPHAATHLQAPTAECRSKFLLTRLLLYGAGALPYAPLPARRRSTLLPPLLAPSRALSSCHAAADVLTPHRRHAPCRPPQPRGVPSLPPLLLSSGARAYTSAPLLRCSQARAHVSSNAGDVAAEDLGA